jgi:type II secretory pathway component PulK
VRESAQVCPACARGSILIVTMWVMIGLAAMVLVLAEAMRVEVVSSANEYSALQAQAVEEGAVRYVVAQLDPSQEGWVSGQVPLDANVASAGTRVGQGAFWIIRPYSTDMQTLQFGLVDEASKVNLNYAPLAMLSMLPDMTTDMVNCIGDWRSTNNHGGAKSDYYMGLNPPYQCKQAPFETVEELLLVKNITTDILFGQDANRNGVQDAGEAVGLGQFDRGFYPFVTAYSNQAPPGTTTTAAQHAINVGTAPAEVLAALPGLTSSDVSNIITARQQSNVNLTTFAWFRQALNNPAKFNALYPVVRGVVLPTALIADKTYQFSADILSVAGDGRAFKRCRIVVDNRRSPPRVVYRQDTTPLGWPLSPDVLTKLRAGKPIDQVLQSVPNAQGLAN